MFKAFLPLLAELFKFLVVKILTALGIAFVSYKGYEIALNKFKDYISGNFNNMPSDIANLLLIAGFGEGLGFLFGALVFSMTMQTVNKISFGNKE